MANIKSQKKRIITNEKRRMRNRAVKSELKTATRRVREAVEAGDGAKAYAEACAACRLMDKAVTKGVIKKNQAANRKSGIMALANTIVTEEDRKAYKAPERKVAKSGSNKKKDAKAARVKAMADAQAEKDKRRAAQAKLEEKANARKAKEAEEAAKAEAEAAAAEAEAAAAEAEAQELDAETAEEVQEDDQAAQPE
ncbi:MAG: 30S ribosomal protein S20 [Eggerthellaceae bacterium]|nr:30S ribosomal protein S20 [Eggerthellaceae bacterium]